MSKNRTPQELIDAQEEPRCSAELMDQISFIYGE